MSESLGEALPREQARCRELLGEYKSVGRPGAFAAAMLEQALAKADQAIVNGDLVGMIQAYKELKDFK